MRLFMPKELFLTLTKVSVYVCVCSLPCVLVSLYLVLLSLLTSGQLAYIVPAATKHPDMHSKNSSLFTVLLCCV